MKLLETQRLLLRPWKESDAEALFAYAHTPNVGPAAGWKPHGSIEETRAILKSFMEEDETWAVVLRSNSQLLGSFGLHRDAMRGSEIKARAWLRACGRSLGTWLCNRGCTACSVVCV